MNKEQLLQRLNHTPLAVNENLIKLKIQDCHEWMQIPEGRVKDEMKLASMRVGEDFMEEKYIIEYINRYLLDKDDAPLFLNGKINLNVIRDNFSNDSLINSYLYYRKYKSRIKQNETLLKQIKDGCIQPKFAINSAGSIYTAKPSLQIPHDDLACYFDCTYYHFDSLERAMKAIANAKKDTEIVTVIKKTVYYRNTKYFDEKEMRRQEVIKEAQNNDFIPLICYSDECELEYLGLSYLLD